MAKLPHNTNSESRKVKRYVGNSWLCEIQIFYNSTNRLIAYVIRNLKKRCDGYSTPIVYDIIIDQKYYYY